MKRALAIASALLVAGCLGDLVRPAGEDGGTGDGGSGDGGSPDAALPTDTDIRIAALVADLDRDDIPDLTLVNDAPIAGERSILVYFGKAAGFFDEPDLVLSTSELHPLVASKQDFYGGARYDLMVLARDDDGVPYLILFEQSGDRVFTQAASTGFPGRAIGGGTVSMPEPVFAVPTFIRQSALSPPGMVFGSLAEATYVSIEEDWSAVTASDGVALASGSDTMNLVVPIPSAQPDRNDLLVLDNQGITWMSNDSSVTGGYQVESPFAGLWPQSQRAFFAFEVPGDDAPDFMTLAGSDLRVVENSWSDNLPTVVPRMMDPSPTLPDSRGDALFATDIDDTGVMDLLVLDDVEPPVDDADHFRLLVAGNISPVDGSTISPASGRIDVDGSHAGSPTRLVAGDFDGDGNVEVWVFDETLALKMCLLAETYETDKIRFNECP